MSTTRRVMSQGPVQSQVISSMGANEMYNDRPEQRAEENEANLEADFARSVCHELQLCDMCTALVCPCITYGEVLEEMEPASVRSESTFSVGCMLWTGCVAVSLAAVEVPLLVPGACSWLPTTYFGGVLDARQLLLTLSYFVPQCVCHWPLRYTLLDGQENVCTSCVNSVLCSCCSLGSMKQLAKEENKEFDEKEACLGRWLPWYTTLYPRRDDTSRQSETTYMMPQNSMKERSFRQTGSHFWPEMVVVHRSHPRFYD